MILKKQEKNGVIKAMYGSATVLASVFDTTKNELTVIFNNGGKYSYAGVTEADYKAFEGSDSQGKTLNATIKKYPYTKLTPMDANILTSMINEIEQLKKNQGDDTTTVADEKKLVASMSLVVAEYLNTGKINANVLKEIKGILSAAPKAVVA
jgi:hypothetical protein